MLSLCHRQLVLIRHLDPELVGGLRGLGLTVCKECPVCWRVGGRVEGHVVGHDGGEEVMSQRWLMIDVYNWIEWR